MGLGLSAMLAEAHHYRMGVWGRLEVEGKDELSFEKLQTS
jgi:tellurite resistance-related uncharacterized protein